MSNALPTPTATPDGLEPRFSLPPETPQSSRTSLVIGGVRIYVYGLDELENQSGEINVLYLAHNRTRTYLVTQAIAHEILHRYRGSKKEGQRGMIAVTMNMRNHGDREICPEANLTWAKGNEKHGLDLLSGINGATHDFKLILDYLPCYLPQFSRFHNIMMGVSLGGHTAWRMPAMAPGQLEGLVMVVGCPSLTSLLLDRLDFDAECVGAEGSQLHRASYNEMEKRMTEVQKSRWPRSLANLVQLGDLEIENSFPDLPILLCNGKYDKLVPARHTEAWLDSRRSSGKTPSVERSCRPSITMPSSHPTPELLDLTIDNITPNTIRINSQCSDVRLKYLMERLVTHVHDFARETRLSTDEWMAAIQFLTSTGQICTDVRQEFILLSDILGMSLLVDSINHPKPAGCTEGSVLGPFHTHDAPTIGSGAAMSDGNPIPDVRVDIWETDASGHYDVQHGDRGEPSERCVMHSDQEGKFWFKAITPVSYPIPTDGPVGKLLSRLGRHPWRPAHMHFKMEKPGWDHLITAVYIRGDPYEKTDAVFGVKQSLIVDLETIDEAIASQYGVQPGTKIFRHDFVLASEEETAKLRDRNAMEALKNLGLNMKLVEHLPVPDLD
ncbi:hypothetical protein NLG97_g1839 [Lecanicillium saksenae]|uniref:Uncharacterized protein n=1 Tax=Lecanicillium saksenae TaxID=468837 RepID=A0ACC1R4C8_9HYPO|nr:hypothetical protein NLG97_g1839 [Lecanicillium saksenae]